MIMDLEHIGNKCGFVDTGMLNKCSQLVGGDKDMVKVFKYKGLKNEKEIKSNGQPMGIGSNAQGSVYNCKFH